VGGGFCGNDDCVSGIILHVEGFMTDIQVPIPPEIARIAPDGNLTPRQKRQFLIRMALRRVRPGTGSSVEFMQRRTALNPWPDLREILQGIDWVLVGGVATRAYMPERMTKDMDILVRRSDEKKTMERLKKSGYKVISRLAIPGFLLRSPEGVDLDVILGDYPWVDEALQQPELDQAGYPVISLPYLILMKMEANRGRDFGDLTTMLGWAGEEELDKVRTVIARFSPEDSGDLESLIFIGKKEREVPPSPE
jgi:hypothetical protein